MKNSLCILELLAIILNLFHVHFSLETVKVWIWINVSFWCAMLNKESCLFKVGTYSGPSVNGVALMPVWGPALIGGGVGCSMGADGDVWCILWGRNAVRGGAFGEEWGNWVRLDSSRGLWYLILRIFWPALHNFYFWEGGRALGSILTFPNIS